MDFWFSNWLYTIRVSRFVSDLSNLATERWPVHLVRIPERLWHRFRVLAKFVLDEG